MFGNLFGGSAATTAAAETAEAITTEYAGVTVPVFNIIMEALALVLLIGAAIAAVLVIRKHVKDRMLPFVSALIFYLVFVYVGVQLLYFGLNFWASKSTFWEGKEQLVQLIALIATVIFNALTLVVGMLYWRRSCRRDHRQMSLGSAFAFGLAFYVGSLFTGGFIGQLFQMVMNSRYINSMGFDAVVNSYLQQEGADQETVIKGLLDLASDNAMRYVGLLLQAFIIIFEGVAFMASAAIFWGALSEKLEKKWYAVAIALNVLVFAPSFVSVTVGEFDGYVYVALAYALALAAVGVFLVLKLAKNHMPEELEMLKFSRRKQKEAEERAKNKIPKIVMPRDYPPRPEEKAAETPEPDTLDPADPESDENVSGGTNA